MVNYKDVNLNFLDIETTGSNYHRDKITEVYISKVRNGELIDSYHTLINPKTKLDPFITKLTGLTNAILEKEPLFEDVAEDIFEFINDEIVIAHNARFDYSFLKHHLGQFGYIINLNYCCTVKLSRLLYPRFKSHSLDSIIDRIGYSSKSFDDYPHIDDVAEPSELYKSQVTRHRASYDTDVIREFFYRALAENGEEKFSGAFNTSVKSSAIPQALLKIKMENIPESPGVYFFYGDQEEIPIYIGMSKNLRRRVYDHFYQDLTYIKDFNINQQLKKIEFIETAGILGALIREALLVKKYQPLYNVKLRRNRELMKLEKFYDENGYINVKIKSEKDLNINNIENLVGIFRSKIDLIEKLNNLVKENGLCPKLLGLEKGRNACFSYQLGQCKGACINKIPPDEYNRIFEDSVKAISIQNWPYESEKMVTEKSENLEETFIFNKWCLINSTANDNVFKENEQFRFDLDIYKILNRYLKLY